jgi:AcrR family transcriptional regulator
VSDTAQPRSDHADGPAQGLRERKKRLLRQQLSDTATRLFMEQGFEAVRVADVAEACGVSEATVFNHFSTKEALVLDRLEATMASLPAGFSSPGTAPLEAALRMLDQELKQITDSLQAQNDPRSGSDGILRFGDLIRATPSLRAYQSDMMDRFVSVVARVLASHAGLSPDDPEPQIAARALLGLWHVQFQSLRKHLRAGTAPDRLHQAVMADLGRAARLIGSGLESVSLFEATPRGSITPPR